MRGSRVYNQSFSADPSQNSRKLRQAQDFYIMVFTFSMLLCDMQAVHLSKSAIISQE